MTLKFNFLKEPLERIIMEAKHINGVNGKTGPKPRFHTDAITPWARAMQAHRIAHGFSQREVGELLKLDEGDLSHIERCLQTPTPEEVLAFSQLYSVPVETDAWQFVPDRRYKTNITREHKPDNDDLTARVERMERAFAKLRIDLETV